MARKPPGSMTKNGRDNVANPFKFTPMPLKHTTVTSPRATSQARRGNPSPAKAQASQAGRLGKVVR